MMTSRWYVLDHDGWWQASLRTTTRADGLCLGALAAIALPGIRRRRTRITDAVVVLSLAASVTLVATTPWLDQFAYLRAQGIAFVVAATVLVLALARAHDAEPATAAERGVVRRALSSRFLSAIGRVSLPLYIWHLPAFYAASRWAPGGGPAAAPRARGWRACGDRRRLSSLPPAAGRTLAGPNCPHRAGRRSAQDERHR